MFVRRSLVVLLLLPVLALAAGVSGNAEAPSAAPSSTPVAQPTVLSSARPEASASPGSPAPVAPSASPRAGLSALLALPVPSSPPTLPYATFIRGAERQAGVIDIIRKEDDLYFDLKPENFGKPYIILPSLATGVGGSAFAGRVYDPLVVVFRRVGKRILWITPNSRYVAAKGSSAAASLAISVADSVVQSTPVVAEDPAKTHVVIAPSIFLSDFEGIGADLGKSAAPPAQPGLLILFSARPSFGVDSSKSYYVRTKAFPRNDEISVNLTFNGPPNALPTVPDGRGIPIVVHYSIVAPPDSDKTYVPRYADDRVGYFITARKHYGTNAASPFERFIERWNLNSGPIVFTLTREIPQQYRGTVRRAILAWNDAFAKAGYPHAIEVNDPPADPNWDPEDARYNSVRWITSDTSDFVAISPHFADPANGQIIQASVVIDGESVRAVHRGFIDRVLPVRRTRDAAARYADALAGAPSAAGAADAESENASEGVDSQSCDYGETSVGQASVGMTALAAHRHATEAFRDRYTQEWLTAVVMHEVGHTLGLRHNFEGSTAYTYAQVHDPSFTHVHGTSGSVMDYNPANIAAPKERQADYFDTKLGPYDYWAIRYGYMKLKAASSYDELVPLRHLAAQSTSPGLAYGSDEDAIDPFDLDPRIQRYDLSNNTLRFAQVQFAIDEDVARSLTHTYAGDARSYQDIRQTFVSVLNNELGAAELSAHYIGGMYTSRAHRGQRGAELPFRPIARAEQRRAFLLIADHIFSSRAFRYSPQLLNELTPARFGFHWHSGIGRTDFPIREVVEEIQDDSVSSLFSPGVMARLADQSLKTSNPNSTMSLADLFAWSNASIYDDIGQPRISELHRELQRRFTDLQIEIAFLPAGAMAQLGLPRETQALARYELRGLNARLGPAYRVAADTATRAHVDDLRSRIGASLDPKANRSI